MSDENVCRCFRICFCEILNRMSFQLKYNLMAHFHQRRRRRRRIPKRILVLCRFFHWYGDRFQSPDSNVWNRDGDLSLGWRSIPKMGTVTIWETLYRDLDPNPNQWKKSKSKSKFKSESDSESVGGNKP